ncbi:MAG: trehalose-phosphatase [Candidatus Competibacteraceae bacterium]
MPLVNHVILERLTSAYLQGKRLVLAFDYDGTLTPLAAHPSLACLDPTLRGLLARLAATPRVTVGVVSGRALDNLIGMVGLAGLCFGGTCGLELDLCGARTIPTAAFQSRELIDALIDTVEARLPPYPGTWVEKKPFGMTIHYRQVAHDQIQSFQAVVMSLLEPHSADLHILDAPLAIEVLPAIGLDKGTALQAIVAHGGAKPATVLYAGDAANDAPALAAAVELGGIALGIGPEPPAVAEYRLSDPAALAAWLAALAAALTTIRSVA